MAGQLAQNNPLTFFEKECTRIAAGILGRLYGGTTDVYRSWSLRAQIDQNKFVNDINAIRSFSQMPSLA
jgi:hypothetical protein